MKLNDSPPGDAPRCKSTAIRARYVVLGIAAIIALNVWAWVDDSTDFLGWAAVLSLCATIYAVWTTFCIWRIWRKSKNS
jgi:hypothetical protein